ncbi:MAG: hypothetical protein R6V83_02340 [Candidatus Thorarchaeota archaeon]
MRKTSSSKQKSLLSERGVPSDPGESAAVHHVQMDLLSYGDKAEVGDHDHAVVRTVEELAVAGSDVPEFDRRRKPGPREESYSGERGQSPC